MNRSAITAVPEDYDVTGDLSYVPVKTKLDDLEATALKQRPDYQAAELGVTAAQSQIQLAKANGKQDVSGAFTFTHTSSANDSGFAVSMPWALFDRNQGEIARTQYALTQAQQLQSSASDTVLSDVRNAYEGLRSNDEVVNMYTSGYLKQAQDSRDISQYAYQRGAASLLDFLDAERSYRATQLAYRQALSSYKTSTRAAKGSSRNEESPVNNRWLSQATLTAVATAMLALAGCSGAPSGTAAQSGQNNAVGAELFTIPQNQMAHVQVLTAQPANLSRSLRLTGSVAYNSFHTTPVIPQVGGPVSRILVVPGQQVRQSEPLLYVSSRTIPNSAPIT